MIWIKENWGVVLVLMTGLLLSTLVLGFLQPREPNLPIYEYSEARTPNHQPGGRGCEPQILASIRDRSKAIAERNRCAEVAEEYRLKSNDLVQQTRTADAAVAQVNLTHYLARIGLLGAVGGFLTLIAASLAAYFARDAARAARDSVNALTEVERANAVVTLDNFAMSNVHIQFDIVAHNLGRSSALVIACGFSWRKSNELKDFKGLLADTQTRIIPASDKASIIRGVKITPEKLKENPYLWVLLVTLSPLKGDVAQRFCFQVHDIQTGAGGASYTNEYADEERRKPDASSWWESWGR